MKLSPEQIQIINSQGNIKINAVAGSGKTTTLIEYAKSRPKGSKILYLAFNKSVKIEAVNRFNEQNLDNVKVETAHSLAYKDICFYYGYKVRKQDYKSHEIAEILSIQGNGDNLSKYMVANHVLRLVSYFCNSNVLKVQELNYLDLISDPIAVQFVTQFYDYIVQKTRLFLAKMDKNEIEITHDFYLKKYQLSKPFLHFDYILFDEGQDASPAMLDIFLKQPAIKVIVGDSHQQIYGWRYAINSLDKSDFYTFPLTTSFRFTQNIAQLAMQVLDWKRYYLRNNDIYPINGNGNSNAIKSKATIARTNLGLLLKAIEYVTERKYVKQIYFEGNINSYTYADDGTSLYDVLNLAAGKKNLIKDKLISEMKNIQELTEYVEKTEDKQLGMMIQIVNEYGMQIPNIINLIKEKHVSNENKDKAEMIFSTVHRAKGMEYDCVELVNDFISEEKLEKLKEKSEKEETTIDSKINEEINLLYVAITRTKNKLFIPEELLPIEFEISDDLTDQIHVIREDFVKIKK